MGAVLLVEWEDELVVEVEVVGSDAKVEVRAIGWLGVVRE